MISALGKSHLETYLCLLELFFVSVNLSCEIPKEDHNSRANLIHTEVKVFHVLDRIED